VATLVPAVRKVAAALPVAAASPVAIAVAGAVFWTGFALAVPWVAAGNALALVVIAGVALIVAVTGRGRRLPQVLLAAATAALLIFLAISWLLPGVPGFISDSHPPVYPPVTQLVDPVGELGLAVLLTVIFAVDLIRTRSRSRRQRRPRPAAGPNEMTVERTL
jgi:hypothetical protein